MTGSRGEARRDVLERRQSRRRVLLWGTVLVGVCILVLGSGGVTLLLGARDLQSGAGLHGTWTAVATNCTESGGQCVTWIGTFAPDGEDVTATGVQMDAGRSAGLGIPCMVNCSMVASTLTTPRSKRNGASASSSRWSQSCAWSAS